MPAPRIVTYNQTVLQNGKTTPIMPFLKAGGTHMYICTLHIHPGVFDKLYLNDTPYDDPVFNDMWAQVAAFQQGGGVAMAMIGGWAGGGIALMQFDSNKDKYFQLVCKFLRDKKLQGIDLDIEPQDGQCDNDNTLKLVANFRKVFPNDFRVTFAPMAADLTRPDGTGSSFSRINYPQMYKQSLQANIKIDWFNVQFYNTSYSLNTPNDYNTIIQYGRSHGSFGPWQIVGGVETTGFIDYNTFKNTASSLAKTYNGSGNNAFGGVMGWEYFNSDPQGTNAPWAWAQGLHDAMKNARSYNVFSVASGLRERLQPAMALVATRSNPRENSMAALIWFTVLLHVAAILLNHHSC